MVKVAPRPGPSLAAVMVPPCESTRARLIVRPMPEPEFSRVRELSARKKRSNRRDRSSAVNRSEEHTSELQSRGHLVCRLLLEKKKKTYTTPMMASESKDMVSDNRIRH